LNEDQINKQINQMDTFIESLMNNEQNFWDISPLIIPENRDIMP
jgi:conjugal transfer/entry exclusion protein